MTKNSSVAILVYQDKILLFQRDNKPFISNPNKWQLPGGNIEPGESHKAAIKRELAEEICFVPKVLKYLGAKRRVSGVIQHYYYARLNKKTASKIKLGAGEGQFIGFYTVSEITKLDLVSYFRYFVNKNYDYLNQMLFYQNAPQTFDQYKKLVNGGVRYLERKMLPIDTYFSFL